MPLLKSKFCIDEQNNKILALNKTKKKGDSNLTRVAISASGIIKRSKKQKGVMKLYPLWTELNSYHYYPINKLAW